ncbi:tol-pal system-associated acyl-CoA thioesterase [Mycetohabitans rhizoxinica]|uniref:tol-pal system-associated acyl-CoA thioesterase n=1 Tax=Mycetohabitans rhizoxinica TaxID=412963 RepID=UPI0030D0A886
MPRMNMISPEPAAQPGFTWPVRVYFEDTDAGGIVFYANYLKFFERARTEWLRACGIDQRRLADTQQIMFVVRSTAVDYRAPARLDDVLIIDSRIERLGPASVDFYQQASCDGKVLSTSTIRVACVQRATIRPVPLPDAVRQALLSGPRDAGLSTLAR